MRYPCAFRLPRLAQDGRCGFVSSEGLCARFWSYVQFAWQAFEVWNVVLRDRRRTSDTFSSMWQAWHFWTLLKHLKRWQASAKTTGGFWRSFFLAGTVFGEFGCRFERVHKFVKPSSFLILGHDDPMRQVQHFGCLGLIFRARRSIL